MAREIIVVKWCDNPLHEEESEHSEKQPAVAEHYITLNRGKPHVLDLCATCEDAVIHPLQALLQVAATVDGLPKAGNSRPKPKSGLTPTRAAAGGQELIDSYCEYPGCNKGQAGTPFIARSRTGLGAHMHRSHNVSLSDFESANQEDQSGDSVPSEVR